MTTTTLPLDITHQLRISPRRPQSPQLPLLCARRDPKSATRSTTPSCANSAPSKPRIPNSLLPTRPTPARRRAARRRLRRKCQHPRPMFSLGNAFDDEEFLAWHKRVSELLDGEPFDMVCELKYDGLAVALTYENGVFIRGATRGQRHGRRGCYRQPPHRQEHPPATAERNDDGTNIPRRLEVRGEVYFPKSKFCRVQCRNARPTWRANLRQPAQHRRRFAAPTRPAQHRRAPPRHLHLLARLRGRRRCARNPLGTCSNTSSVSASRSATTVA